MLARDFKDVNKYHHLKATSPYRTHSHRYLLSIFCCLNSPLSQSAPTFEGHLHIGSASRFLPSVRAFSSPTISFEDHAQPFPRQTPPYGVSLPPNAQLRSRTTVPRCKPVLCMLRFSCLYLCPYLLYSRPNDERDYGNKNK